MHLSLPAGSRCLLLGANGAGKTTLLKVLGGKHLVPRAAVSVLGGRSPFHDTGLASSGALSYLGGNWERDVAFAGFSVPLAADFGAGEMLERASAPGAEGAARREKLVEVLDIDPEWRMHRVSDGQRRRVQIAMGEYFFAFLSGGSSLARGLFSSSKGEKKKRKKNPREWEKTKKTHLSFSLSPTHLAGLLKPFDVLLLDEITVDLDVLGRADLMKFLTDECEGPRRATIVYATHIFDGLDAWPTHVAFLARGKLRRMHTFEELRGELEQGRLLELVEGWLRHEEAEAAAEKREGGGGGGGAAPLRGGTGAGNDGVASWSNGWAAGRMTSTLKNSSNAVMRM